MNYVTVLAMHGVPPKGFPREEIMELFSLHMRLQKAGGPESSALKNRHDQLEEKIRKWPRTEENDPFFTASQKIADKLGQTLGCEVYLGFNEFCAPSLDEALEKAAAKSPDKIFVITPMMTRGGEHSEIDIPKTINRAQERFPNIPIVYAWPFESQEIANFLAGQVRRFL